MRNDFFDQSENSMPRIGDQAPAFRAVTTQGAIYFPADYFGKWVILFSYPTDFKLISATETLFFTVVYNDLKALNCELVGLSVHGNCSYKKLHSLEENIDDSKKHDFKVNFPVIEDRLADVIRKYRMIQSGKDNSDPACKVFIIDPQCIIRAQLSYSKSLGYSFDELKKVIIALQSANAIELTSSSLWNRSDKIISRYQVN